MKRHLPLIFAGLAVVWFLTALIPPRDKAFEAAEFGRLPVLLNGRVQPLDSVARNALLQLRAKQSVRVVDRKTGRVVETLSAVEWLKEALFQAEVADTRPAFRIDHPDVIALLKIQRGGQALLVRRDPAGDGRAGDAKPAASAKPS
jgi:hypothetical protein